MRGSGDEAGERPAAVGAYDRLQTVRDRWDCESVLSLRSNLDNHPASITEPQSSRRPRRQVVPSASSNFVIISRTTSNQSKQRS